MRAAVYQLLRRVRFVDIARTSLGVLPADRFNRFLPKLFRPIGANLSFTFLITRLIRTIMKEEDRASSTDKIGLTSHA